MIEMNDTLRRAMHRPVTLKPPAKSPETALKRPEQPTEAPLPQKQAQDPPRANSHDQHQIDRPSPCSKPERPVRHEPLGSEAGKESHASGVSGRVRVRVLSYRRRLIDPDNLTAKYFVDACRYSGLIRDDTAKEIEFTVGQVKVATKAEQRTEIEIVTP